MSRDVHWQNKSRSYKTNAALLEFHHRAALACAKTVLGDVIGLTSHFAWIRLDAKCNCNPQLQLFEPKIISVHDHTYTV